MFMKIGHNFFVYEKTSNSFTVIREASKANKEYLLGHKRGSPFVKAASMAPEIMFRKWLHKNVANQMLGRAVMRKKSQLLSQIL